MQIRLSATLTGILALAFSTLLPAAPASAQAGAADPAELGRADWLEIVSEPQEELPPSSIDTEKARLFWGDLFRLDIVLSNESDVDRRLDVVANLGLAAFFVDASHGAELVEPEKAEQTREIAWRGLSLPAHSSGRLELTLVLRPDEDAGDVTVDVEARDLLSAAEPLRLNFYRQLSYDPALPDSSGPLWAYVVIFCVPATLLLFAVLRFTLGSGHTATRLAGRLAAFFGAVLLSVLIGYGMIRGVVDSYAGATETTCTVLDRRADPESMSTTTSVSGESTQRSYLRPLIAAEYESWKGRQVAVGFGSDIVSPGMDAIADYQVGDEVTCWYDNERPNRFFVVRGYDFGAFLIFGFAMLASLVLLWVAFRPWKKSANAA